MIFAPFRVLLDANVIYPFTLRDTLLRGAEHGCYQVYWSQQILDEATKNLVKNETMKAAQAKRLQVQMANAFPEAMVEDYESLINGMNNHPGDRHVAAAALKAKAQIIVTQNTKHFKNVPDDVTVQNADEFLTSQYGLFPYEFAEIIKEQASALRNPPQSVRDIIEGLRKSAPNFATMFLAEQ